MIGSVFEWPDLRESARAKLVRSAVIEAVGERSVTSSDDDTQFHRIPLYPKQAAIVDDPARFTMTEASTKSGKTMSHIEWLLECGARRGFGNSWWVAPSYSQATMAFDRTVLRLRGYLMHDGKDLERVGPGVPHRKNISDKWIEAFGVRFWFKTAEKPDNLYGEDVFDLVGDEITRWRESAWFACYTTLTATEGRAKLIGNVKGRTNFAYRLARKAESGEPGWGYHKLAAHDAIEGGVISAAVVEDARRELPDHVFRELYLAEPSDDGGNPFGLAHIRLCSDGVTMASTPAAVWGWDLAKSVDWTVGVALDQRGHVCGFERFQRPWQETIRTIGERTGRTDAWVDSTGVGDPVLEALQRPVSDSGNGRPRLQAVEQRLNYHGYIFSSASKQRLMEGLAVAIQQQHIRFPETGPIRTEAESFGYEYTRTGVRYTAGEGLHDDCVMALALAWHGLAGRAHRTVGVPAGRMTSLSLTQAPSWRIE